MEHCPRFNHLDFENKTHFLARTKTQLYNLIQRSSNPKRKLKF